MDKFVRGCVGGCVGGGRHTGVQEDRSEGVYAATTDNPRALHVTEIDNVSVAVFSVKRDRRHLQCMRIVKTVAGKARHQFQYVNDERLFFVIVAHHSASEEISKAFEAMASCFEICPTH